MPRTKLAKKQTNKKNRRSSTDPQKQMENQLRELESFSINFMPDLEVAYQQSVDDHQKLLRNVMMNVPKSVLTKTIGELKDVEARTFAEAAILCDKNLTMTTASAGSNLSTIMEKSYRKTGSKDDGYLTEESEASDRGTYKKSRVLGPLQSSKARRRSKSVGIVNNTPSFTSTLKLKTPLIGTIPTTNPYTGKENERLSRSKYRTPLNRIKAASADRSYLITPKVNPGMPMAILRHAKAGESIFSLTGSPVITSNVCEETANVNIPIFNGVLSIRPTEMRNVDSAVINKIDANTMADLKQLQSNLNKILRLANLNVQ